MQHPSSTADGTSRPGQRPNSSSTYVAAAAVVALFGALAIRQASGPIPDTATAGNNARGVVLTRINPNTATLAELTTLPGIGEAKAERIMAFREAIAGTDKPRAHAFDRPEDLARVRGIGPKTVERMRRWLRFDD